MARESERTYVMKENFMAMHEGGYGIPEIARTYNLSRNTVYRHLEEIALQNGFKSREDLLQRIVSARGEPALRKAVEKTKASFKELDENLMTLENTIKESIQKIDNIIKEDKNYEECI